MPESEQEWKEAYEAREHNIAAARQQVSVVVNELRVVVSHHSGLQTTVGGSAWNPNRALEAAENALRQLRDIAAGDEDDE